jgi:hypothetical protein
VDLYTLSPTFLAADDVDEFVSAIWTERFTKSGDCQIVVPATGDNIDKLREGTYLALRGSKEVMELDTQSIEKNQLTVTGKTLTEAVLIERFLWAFNPSWDGSTSGGHTPDDPKERVADYTSDTRKPGEFISHLVDRFVINTVAFPATNGQNQASLDWAHEEIAELSLGDIDHSGDVQRLTAPLGPLYNALETLADQFKVGISLYLDSADPVTGFRLKFKTYKGLDRTSAQSVNELVRLTPELDGISDIKEIRSVADYKNVAYVYYEGVISKHLLFPDDPEPEGLDRRVLVVDAEGEPVGRKVMSWGGPGGYFQTTIVDSAAKTAFRAQQAKDALANHNYVHTIDGQTSPISDYKFGTDYFLGDLIELEGITGSIAQAQITEYIRSQDKSGEKSYPTISVV